MPVILETYYIIKCYKILVIFTLWWQALGHFYENDKILLWLFQVFTIWLVSIILTKCLSIYLLSLYTWTVYLKHTNSYCTCRMVACYLISVYLLLIPYPENVIDSKIFYFTKSTHVVRISDKQPVLRCSKHSEQLQMANQQNKVAPKSSI